MVESDCPPRQGLVAAFTVFSQFALVRVLLPVAGMAIRRRIRKRFSALVTGDACDGSMTAFEHEIGETMIETFLVQVNDIGIAPFMVGMTGHAF